MIHGAGSIDLRAHKEGVWSWANALKNVCVCVCSAEKYSGATALMERPETPAC